MLKSINGWFWPAGTPVEEMIDQASEAGFEAVELTYGGDRELGPNTTHSDCRRITEQFADRRLNVASVACADFWQTCYSDPDPAKRAAAADLTLRTMDLASWCGTDAILVVPAVVGTIGGKAPVCGYEDAMWRVYDALCRLAPEAEARGVKIGVENVWNKFLMSPLEARELIDRVNSPWVGIYFDVGNVLAFGFSEDWIDLLGGRIVRVHLKDYDLDKGGLEGFCPLLEGSVNWPAVMAALRDANYDGPLTYEGGGDIADVAEQVGKIAAM